MCAQGKEMLCAKYLCLFFQEVLYSIPSAVFTDRLCTEKWEDQGTSCHFRLIKSRCNKFLLRTKEAQAGKQWSDHLYFVLMTSSSRASFHISVLEKSYFLINQLLKYYFREERRAHFIYVRTLICARGST